MIIYDNDGMFYAVQVVTYLGKGLDRIPLVEYRELGLAVANGGSTNATAMAEAGIMLMLSATRQLIAGNIIIIPWLQ